jgi:transposase
MPQKFTPSYPPAYRTEAVRALRAGRQPEELARELGVSGQSLRNWLKQADLDEGIRKVGLTSEERSEVTRLRREVHRLRQEKEVLKKAAVFFAGETNSIR